MDVVAFLVVFVVLAVAVAVVSAPLRRPAAFAEQDESAVDIGALEAAREAKYREIREADLDRRTGKLSPQDWEAIDRRLRAEAVEILNRLERAAE